MERESEQAAHYDVQPESNRPRTTKRSPHRNLASAEFLTLRGEHNGYSDHSK